MKTLVLNGAKDDKSTVNMVSDYLIDFLRINGHEVEVITLRNENIANCIGCFGCWLKTPGHCIINDDGYDLPRKVIQSDAIFLLSPVVFGMYGPVLKRALDRFPCPILLPFFTNINGEIHHAKRYEKYPALVAVGVLPNPDQESESTFRTLVEKNGVNLHTTAVSNIVYSTDELQTIKEKVKATLLMAGVQ
jgi:multimeric flavodoxin WrbA